MKLLRAIGRFFARIGRWIRDTAWVQPLLIVGGIFAVIFSIPYITSWVQSWFKSSGDDAVNFYEKYQLTLDGNTDTDSDPASIKTTLQADRLMKYMTVDGGNAEYRNEFGDKFFFVIVEENCDPCSTAYPGFDYLIDNWEGKFFVGDKLVEDNKDEFKMYTIFADELNDDSEKLFTEYFYKRWGESFFNTLAETETPYINNVLKLDEDGLANKLQAGGLATPTIFLYDRNFDASSQNGYQLAIDGVTEMMFSVSGSSDYEKAKLLWNCWYHQEEFATPID